MRCWEPSPWINRYPTGQSKNSEAKRVAKLRAQRVSLEEGLGRPQDKGCSVSRPPPSTTRTTGCSGPEGGKEEGGGGVLRRIQGGRDGSARQWDRFACQGMSFPSPQGSQLSHRRTEKRGKGLD